MNLARIHSLVKEQHPSASASELRNETVETIRSLANDGLVEVGYFGDDARFVPEPLDQWMREFYAAYITHHDNGAEWCSLTC